MNLTFNVLENKEVCLHLEWNFLFLFITVLLTLVAALACTLSLKIFRLLWRHGLFHANVRLMLLHFCAANALASFCAFLKALLYNFSLIIFGFSRLAVNGVTCALLDTLGCIPIIVICLMVGAIGYERCLATCRKNVSSPDISSRTFKCITFSSWLFSALNMSVLIVDAGRMGRTHMCYCLVELTVSELLLFINIPFYFCFEISYLLCYLYVYVKNKQDLQLSINTAKHNLHERYLKWNNIHLSESFLANIVSNSILFMVVGCLFYFMYPYYWREQSINSINANLCIFLLISFVSFLQPLLLLVYNEKLKKAAINEDKLFRMIFCYERYARPAVLEESLNLMGTANGSKLSGSRTIVQHKIDPEESNRILENLWEKYTNS